MSYSARGWEGLGGRVRDERVEGRYQEIEENEEYGLKGMAELNAGVNILQNTMARGGNGAG